MIVDQEADFAEILAGGQRHSMVELPDAMMDTTLFVGNLNEFVNDEDLSNLFQAASTLHSVPACVVRKADMSSLGYAFVSFPNAQEKEAAMLRFHNTKLKGQAIKVEEIQDNPKYGRVRVPERMVAYVIGAATKGPNGSQNGLRRISRDDVERLSRGQPAKKKGYGSRNVPHRLNEEERSEMDRASKKGYVTLSGRGNRRARKGSPLINIHRQWCDAREKPQIMLLKAIGGKTVDQVVVDLSPLRLSGCFDAAQVDDFLVKWKVEILTAADKAGMEVEETSTEDDETFEDESEYVLTVDEANQEAWATKPIWQLPPVTVTVRGERSRAKAMAKELAVLWNIPEPEKEPSVGAVNRRTAGARKGGRTKVNGLSEKRRGGGHRQAY